MPKPRLLEFLVVAMSVSVTPVALIDPAIGAMLAIATIAIGGVLSLRSLPYAYLSIAIATISALALCHYTSKGFFFPTMTSLAECGIALSPSLVIALVLIFIAHHRSRRTSAEEARGQTSR